MIDITAQPVRFAPVATHIPAGRAPPDQRSGYVVLAPCQPDATHRRARSARCASRCPGTGRRAGFMGALSVRGRRLRVPEVETQLALHCHQAHRPCLRHQRHANSPRPAATACALAEHHEARARRLRRCGHSARCGLVRALTPPRWLCCLREAVTPAAARKNWPGFADWTTRATHRAPHRPPPRTSRAQCRLHALRRASGHCTLRRTATSPRAPARPAAAPAPPASLPAGTAFSVG